MTLATANKGNRVKCNMKYHHTGHQSLSCATTPTTKLAVKTVCPMVDPCRGCAPRPLTEDSKRKGPKWSNPVSQLTWFSGQGHLLKDRTLNCTPGFERDICRMGEKSILVMHKEGDTASQALPLPF